MRVLSCCRALRRRLKRERSPFVRDMSVPPISVRSVHPRASPHRHKQLPSFGAKPRAIRFHSPSWTRGAGPRGNANYDFSECWTLESASAGSRRCFLRLAFWASLLLRRFFSPGFRKKECFRTSFKMPSCWTRRLKRRMALSIDSPSKTRISAKLMPPL